MAGWLHGRLASWWQGLLLEAGHVSEEKKRECAELHGSIVLLLDGIITGSACNCVNTIHCIYKHHGIPMDRASDTFPL